MTEADIFYRAFYSLLKEAEKDGAIIKTIDAAAKAPDPATLSVVHNVCKVEEDWIEAIERGLVFIGRAIDEERQFIRSEGEIQPIERVRRVSKESVQHLSRHSDLITRKQKDEIVPDKLYTIKRDSDFAVYENRFLYLLLCDIYDFVSVRREAINSAYREYSGKYSVKKKVVTPTRRLNFAVDMTDEQDDVTSAPADRQCAGAIDRMDKILQSVAFYLHTPLMAEVSHSPKINATITKTNVLLMNKNFHEALLLYEYLIAYESDGYSVERAVENFDPVPEGFMREFSLAALIPAFLTYEHGLGLEDYLKGEFEKEEQRLKEEAAKELERRIADLKKKIDISGGNVEEYMLALEDRIKDLEANLPILAAARAENEQLKGEVLRLDEERKVLYGEIEKLNEEQTKLQEQIKSEREEHQKAMEALRAEYEGKIAALNEEHAAEISALKAQNEEEIKALKSAHAEEIANLKEAQSRDIAALEESYKAKLAALEEAKKRETERLQGAFSEKVSKAEARAAAEENQRHRTADELSETRHSLNVSEKEREVLQARLIALRREYGLLTAADDFTTEEGFNALEHEFEVLGRLVREEWTDVKKILDKEFRSHLFETMHAKKPRKSREYEELSAQVRSRRGARNAHGDPQGEQNAGEQQTDGAQNTGAQQTNADDAGEPSRGDRTTDDPADNE